MNIGYDPDFIGGGIRIPLPRKFTSPLKKSVLRKTDALRDEIFSDHPHFTLVMNKRTRQLIYSAHNINQKLLLKNTKGKGSRGWHKDKDIGTDNQLGNEYYKDRKDSAGQLIPNPYDKGKVLLSNSGGSMMLYDNDGCVIDHVTWSKRQVSRTEEGVALIFDSSN